MPSMMLVVCSVHASNFTNAKFGTKPNSAKPNLPQILVVLEGGQGDCNDLRGRLFTCLCVLACLFLSRAGAAHVYRNPDVRLWARSNLFILESFLFCEFSTLLLGLIYIERHSSGSASPSDGHVAWSVAAICVLRSSSSVLF
jgi:hypothetical protein